MDNGVVVALIGLFKRVISAWAGYHVRLDVFHHPLESDGSKCEDGEGQELGTGSLPLIAFPYEPSNPLKSPQTGQNHFDPISEAQSKAPRGPKTPPPSERFPPEATGTEPPVLDVRPIELGDFEGLTGTDLTARFISDYGWLDYEGGSFTVYGSEQ